MCEVDPKTLSCALGEGHKMLVQFLCIPSLPAIWVESPGIFSPDAFAKMDCVSGHANSGLWTRLVDSLELSVMLLTPGGTTTRSTMKGSDPAGTTRGSRPGTAMA